MGEPRERVLPRVYRLDEGRDRRAASHAAHALREHGIDRRALAQHSVDELAGPAPVARVERSDAFLERLIEAWERADVSALAALLREDARLVMPPTPSWFDGREAIRTFFAEYAFGPGLPRRVRVLATRANRQPAMAVYVSGRAGGPRKAFALVVLRIEHEAIAEMTLFHSPELFDAWGLPAAM